MTKRTKQFDALARLLLTLFALFGGYIALGGAVGAKEAGLVLACVGLNELRLRLKLERSNAKMIAFWSGLFGAAPLLYLLLYLESNHFHGQGLLDNVLLPPVIVALALPFQVFAAYLPGIPRAQHLVYAFVLVETVLGIKNNKLDPLWPYLVAVIVLLAICLVASHAATMTRTKKTLNALYRTAFFAGRDFAPWVFCDALSLEFLGGPAYGITFYRSAALGFCKNFSIRQGRFNKRRRNDSRGRSWFRR